MAAPLVPNDEGDDDDIVADCLDALERGDQERIARILAEHPGDADRVRARIDRVRRYGLVREGAAPAHIGPYRVLQLLGRGGMGEVYLAEQRQPIRRRVAVKVIKLGMDSREVIRRFEAERQALALMDHPHIARVLDAGGTGDGRPFFVMEHVAGVPISLFCARHRLTVDKRLHLILDVCDAVQHAHQKGIIHRDLKPSNVLVSMLDDAPLVKIIDFGIAKATHGTLADATLFTEHGRTVGTLEYMSPEQADPHSVDIDTRADIYSLGVLTYELLTGSLPFERGNVSTPQRPPRPPSARVSTSLARDRIAAERSTDGRALARRLRGDLDWIVLQALAHERSRRYPTAQQLAADIRRHLDDEPVLAGPPGTVYRLGKFVRRNRAAVIAAAAVTVALGAGAVLAALASVREAQANDAAQRSERRFRMLALVELHRDAKAAAATLAPAWPERSGDYHSWLARFGDRLQVRLPEVRAAIRELEGRLAEPQAGAVADPDGGDAFLLRSLQRLAAELERFLDPASGTVATVRARLAWAERVGRLSIEEPAAAWATSIAATRAEPRYDRLHLTPQMGLVPLGADPHSGLQEFAHLRSGRPATRRADGRLEIDDATGIVFVLVPGGAFDMGAQPDADQPHHDPGAWPHESPVHRVELPPFLLAKHEMTRGQWQRLGDGSDPSAPGLDERGATLTWPVTQVRFAESLALLAEHGLMLPTEAMWEYACRAWTVTPYWCGHDIESLRGVANLGATEPGVHSDWPADYDAFPLLAPVDALRANAWGFHHVHGNVWEWCDDWFQPYTAAIAELGRRQRIVADGDRRVWRGGSYVLGASQARSAMRWPVSMDNKSPSTGCRAARRLLRP